MEQSQYPRPTAPRHHIQPLKINGYNQEIINKLFEAADQDNDGKLKGQEAVSFFVKTGLSAGVLSQVWEGATSGLPGGISRASFPKALRLVQCAQAGKDLTPQNIQLALKPTTSYPPIQFSQSPFDGYQDMLQKVEGNFATDQSSSVPEFSFRSDSSDFEGDSQSKSGRIIEISILRGKDLVACDGGLSDPFCEVVYGINREFTSVCSRTLDPVWDYRGKFIKIENQPLKITCWDKGLMDPDTFIGTIIFNEDQLKRGVEGWYKLQKVQTGHVYVKVEAKTTGDGSGVKMQSPRALLESSMLRQSTGLVNLEVRLNPLKPTNCAQLQFLGGFRGCLVAGPSFKGGMLLWSDASTLPSEPLGNVKLAENEDSDNAVAAELPIGDFGSVSSMYSDEQGCFMFTGHQNGRLCQWNVSSSGVPTIMKSWQAHRVGAVLSIGVTMWGDVWTGSAWGSLRCWPNAVSCQPNELRSKELRKSGNERAHSEVSYIIVSKSGQIVWTASRNNVNLWDAYSGQFLGTLNRSGNYEIGEGFINIEHGLDVSSLPTFVLRDTISETEVIGGNRGFKDRLTVQGAKAANMLRKFGTSNKITEEQSNGMQSNAGDVQMKYNVSSMCSAIDGSIWVGCIGGSVEQYSVFGCCLQSMEMHTAITSLAGVGERVWIGLADGQVHICNLDGSPLKLIPMHDASVIGMAVVGPIIYTLGARGKIRGWSAWAPSAADQSSQAAWMAASSAVVQNKTLRILCGTWNVNETKPSPESIQKWISLNKFESADLVVVGLQEVEMGTGSVAAAAAKERMYKQWLEQGNRNAQWWLQEIQNALEKGKQKWVRVGLRQLSGMLIISMIRESLQEYVGDVLTASVACGVAGIGGNKGAVALSFQLYRHRFAFLNSHFAAHQNAVDKRNADYATIVKNLKFSNKTDGRVEEQDEVQDMIETGQGMRDAEVLVWLGDFNYRVNQSRESTEQYLQKRDLEALFEFDQCGMEMKANRVFHGLREGKVLFMPTYKYDKNTTDPMAYDSGEKRRIPAWTDRIFFRGSRQFSPSPTVGTEEGMFKQQQKSLREDPEETIVRALAYGSCPEVPDSDHKPVWAAIWAEVPVVQQDVKRKQVAKILQQNSSVNFKHAQLSCKQNKWQLQQGMMNRIDIENRGEGDGVFLFTSVDGNPIPEWLQILPVQGWLAANSKIQIEVLAIVSDKEFYLVQDMVKEALLQFQWSEVLSVANKGFGQDTKTGQNEIIQVTCVKSGGRSL